MTIPASDYSTNKTTSADTATSTPKNTTTGIGADESTFLKLFVSQLQNQDPLNPQDSTQFVSQLAQFSQLEQLIGINKNTSTLNPAATPDTTTTPTN
jgi:flagellar basal-body rod modification protein FlgD